ncbi:MAG: hypothetical protein IT238_10700 [Bacteroidia bacterium]|nr:hypothetical protein [Bacteroidia bacterium]MCZ2248966.1 hypothetical protein [Bacteroidia bacterium]
MRTALLLLAFSFVSFTFSAKKNVYICTDPKSQYYHLEELCKELEKCNYQVKEVTKGEAEDQNKRLCKVCKENDSKNKKDKEMNKKQEKQE